VNIGITVPRSRPALVKRRRRLGMARLLRDSSRRFIGLGALLAMCVIGWGSSSPNPMLLVGYGSSGVQAQLDSGAADPGGGSSGPLTASPFAIAGQVTGLYPGVTLPLKLTITNHQAFAITVTSMTTTVSNASKPCHAANVSVTSFAGNLPIAAKKKATMTLEVTMLESAPNACQSQRFPFHYAGLATGP
jgi:hypothetical protein